LCAFDTASIIDILAGLVQRVVRIGRWAPALVLGIGLLVFPTTATTAGKLVIRGAETGSHLSLSVSDESILVAGTMGGKPTGCTFTHGHNAATCPLAGATEIEIEMGPADDKVDVADPLPIPLTVHLGDGSDKLLGNDEDDTCYSEGTKRNRCIGGGGDDNCITGSENSDCVGGPGDDFCRHGTGSDGCFGGPGADTCDMGAGQDGCHGGPGNDKLYGGPGADQLYGGPGSDFCDGAPGVGRSSSCETGPGD
jgi:Ca2+-binding RTX toxin-like protein